MRLLLAALILLSFSLPESAYALSCQSPSTKELIQDSDIIFQGVAGKSKTPMLKNDKNAPDSYTRFKVNKIFKGALNETVEIHHNRKNTWPVEYEKGTEYVIFAKRKTDLDIYVTYPCSVKVTLNNLKRGDAAGKLAVLEMQKGKLEALDSLIQRFPDNVWLYLEKGKVLEDFGDHYRAVIVYKEAIDKEPKWGDVTSRANFQRAYLAYGRALFYTKQYQEALPYLKKTAEKEADIVNYQAELKEKRGSEYVEPNYDYVRGAMKLYAANLIHLGDSDALNNMKVDVSGMTFEDMTFSNLDLAEADFSNTSLIRVTVKNTNFLGSSFRGAKVRGEIKNSNFNNAKFLNTFIGGSYENVTFVNSDFNGSEVSGFLFKTVDFRNARFESSIVRANHKGVPVENVNFTEAQFIDSEIDLVGEAVNFKDARYSCDTLFSKGFNPEEHGMIQPQEECPNKSK